jgi:hypothetical protein
VPAAKRYYRSSERYYRLGGTTSHKSKYTEVPTVVPPERNYRCPWRYYRLGVLDLERQQ